MNIKQTSAIALILGSITVQAQQQSKPDQTITSWESAINKHHFKAAYALCNKDSLGSYDHFLEQYGSITSIGFMDMAAPGDDDKSMTTSISAGGEFKDSKSGEGKCEFTFRLMKNKKLGKWEITGISLIAENMQLPETEEGKEVQEGTPAENATTE